MLIRRFSKRRGKDTHGENGSVADEGLLPPSLKTSPAPSIASFEDATPTTPVSEEKKKL
jgi:hypothetical protein